MAAAPPVASRVLEAAGGGGSAGYRLCGMRPQAAARGRACRLPFGFSRSLRAAGKSLAARYACGSGSPRKRQPSEALSARPWLVSAFGRVGLPRLPAAAALPAGSRWWLLLLGGGRCCAARVRAGALLRVSRVPSLARGKRSPAFVPGVAACPASPGLLAARFGSPAAAFSRLRSRPGRVGGCASLRRLGGVSRPGRWGFARLRARWRLLRVFALAVPGFVSLGLFSPPSRSPSRGSAPRCDVGASVAAFSNFCSFAS